MHMGVSHHPCLHKGAHMTQIHTCMHTPATLTHRHACTCLHIIASPHLHMVVHIQATLTHGHAHTSPHWYMGVHTSAYISTWGCTSQPYLYTAVPHHCGGGCCLPMWDPSALLTAPCAPISGAPRFPQSIPFTGDLPLLPRGAQSASSPRGAVVEERTPRRCI